jgi:hypothetical protein
LLYADLSDLATGPSGPTAGFHILPATLRIHLSQLLAAEEIVRRQLRIPAMLPVLATKENDALGAD